MLKELAKNVVMRTLMREFMKYGSKASQVIHQAARILSCEDFHEFYIRTLPDFYGDDVTPKAINIVKNYFSRIYDELYVKNSDYQIEVYGYGGYTSEDNIEITLVYNKIGDLFAIYDSHSLLWLPIDDITLTLTV